MPLRPVEANVEPRERSLDAVVLGYVPQGEATEIHHAPAALVVTARGCFV